MTYEEYCEIIDKSDFYIDSENTYDTKIIEALVKQIPRKPIKSYSYKCPCCGNEVFSYDVRKQKFCSECGQAILWEE